MALSDLESLILVGCLLANADELLRHQTKHRSLVPDSLVHAEDAHRMRAVEQGQGSEETQPLDLPTPASLFLL